MHVYKAHVRGGRIELDEKADLPEGAAVHVTLVEAKDDGFVLLDPDDDMAPERRKALIKTLRRGIADAKAGRDMDMEEFLTQLESEP